jgi:hypothetical protein
MIDPMVQVAGSSLFFNRLPAPVYFSTGCRLQSIFQQVAGSIQSLNKALRPFTSSNGELRLKNKWLKP